MMKAIFQILFLLLGSSVMAQDAVQRADSSVVFVNSQSQAAIEPIDFDRKAWNRSVVKSVSGGASLGVDLGGLALYGLTRMLMGINGDSPDFSWFDAACIGTGAALCGVGGALIVSGAKDGRRAGRRGAGTKRDGAAPKGGMATGSLPFRFEVSGGVNLPLENVVGDGGVGYTFGVEARAAFWRSNFDLGLRVAYDNTHHTQCYDSSYNNLNNLRLGVYCDYNFLPHNTVNPFIGAGLGIPFFSPRVGVEIARHHRVTALAHVSFRSDPMHADKAGANIGLCYGYVF